MTSAKCSWGAVELVGDDGISVEKQTMRNGGGWHACAHEASGCVFVGNVRGIRRGRHMASSNAGNYRLDVRTVNNPQAEIASAPHCAVREVSNSSKFLDEKSASDPENYITYVREMRLNDEKR